MIPQWTFRVEGATARPARSPERVTASGSGTAAGSQSGSVRSQAQSRRSGQHPRQAAVSRYRSFDSRKMSAP